jgi:hypothetical protein
MVGIVDSFVVFAFETYGFDRISDNRQADNFLILMDKRLCIRNDGGR